MVPGGIGLRDTDNFDSAFGNGSVARQWADLNGLSYGVPYVLQPDVVVGNASLWTLLLNTRTRAAAAGGTLDIFVSTGLLEGGGAVVKQGATITEISTVGTTRSMTLRGQHSAQTRLSLQEDPVAVLEALHAEGLSPLRADPLNLPPSLLARLRASQGGGQPDTASPVTWTATQFIDASYDGDLTIAAGVSYTYGRESQAQYGESLAGVQPFNTFQNFKEAVNPYVNGADGQVLPFIETVWPLPAVGSADGKMMPYSYRSCLTQNKSGQVPFPQPPGYTASDFEIVRRYVASFNATKYPHGPSLNEIVGVYTYGGPVGYPARSDRAMKYDMCEGGGGTDGQTSPVTTDQPDLNDGYVQADRTGRAVIAAKVYYWVAGLMWTLANDPGIPAGTRNSTNSYGLCADSAAYWGPAAWPTQLYIREGTRMISDYVANQVNVVKGLCMADSVASSAWTIDIHPMRRVAVPAGAVYPGSPGNKPPYGNAASAMNEGQVGFKPFPGNGTVWEVRYAIMTPRRAEATNLLVPVCNSASHVVYGSIRVEPTFIQIGQAAGAAAYLAIKHGVAVQDVPLAELQAMQRANGVEPHYPPGRCPN